MSPLSVSVARDLIRAKISALEAEFIPLTHARGRILRQAIYADTDQPPFDRSAMDGYALCLPEPLNPIASFRIIGTVAAGPIESPLPTLQPGEAVRLFTGAPVPPHVQQVIPQENIRRTEETIAVTFWPQVSFIRRQGEDVRSGEELVPIGQVLNAVDLSVAASVGQTTLSVTRAPRVLHITTGNELIPPAQIPGLGQIRDSNSTLVRGLVEASGACLIGQFHSGDHPEELINAIRAFNEPYDLLLISGGASVGDYDYSAMALENLGYDLHFRQVDVRPGKPLIFGTNSVQVAFGLPGNPVSHLVTFRLFVHAAIAQFLQALPAADFRTGPLAVALHDIENARETYWPARANSNGSFTPLPWQSSGHLASLVAADTLIRIPARTSPWPAGQIVEGWPLANL